MEELKENQNGNGKKMIGGCNYLNKNCWLVKNLNYAPYKRCQYCELKFRHCLFLQYQVISLILLALSFSLFLIFEKRLPALVIIIIFGLVIIYGYFFNNSTEKIIKSNFNLKKTKDALKDMTDDLEDRVRDQTKDIKEKGRHLQELLNMKSDFLRVVNHQLNTPLSVMNSYFSMLEEGSYPAEKALPSIKAGLERINSTVADFWNAYELEGERMKMNQQKTDIAEIVNRLILEKKKIKAAQEKNLTIEAEKPEFKIPTVWCDYKKISHVISNLLDNGIHYTRQGKVVVSYELAGKDFLKINVKDTGAGIYGEDKEKIFQKFSRGEKATDLRPDGSGLGLFIAKKIVGGNGGDMTYYSAGKNKGTTFSFTLPIYKNQRIDMAKEKSVPREKIVRFKK